VQRGLLAGLGADTPVAVVQHASLPQQRHACCPLRDLSATIAAEGLGSPAIIIVGDVVRGAMSLAQYAPQVRIA
jgi:uroporphyrin-III C-methyltransferase